MLLRLSLLLCFYAQCCHALLEERFVAFESGNITLQLQDATIIHDGGDPETVQIAVRSLSSDWEDITGSKAEICQWASNSTCQDKDAAIIVGTVESSLIKALVDRNKIDISDIEGKWETFQTSVVNDPLSGVRQALVIAGSDKRGAAYGVYTLAEQSGQSP